MERNDAGADDALAALIDAAIHLGGDGDRIVRLAREQGWRPLDDLPGEMELLEGVLADGTHVPVRIYHAAGQNAGSWRHG